MKSTIDPLQMSAQTASDTGFGTLETASGSGRAFESRIPGFYALSIEERQRALADKLGIDAQWLRQLAEEGGLSLACADDMVENVIGTYRLPLGIALNFCINGAEVLVPMVIEEPSVIAAASFAAKLVSQAGGFVAESDPPLMAAQVELRDVPNITQACEALLRAKAAIMAACDEVQPGLKRRGGGARDVEVRILDERTLVVHLIIDCREAMGANAVNTVAEALAPMLEKISAGRAGLKILSNLADKRCVRVTCQIPVQTLAIHTADFTMEGQAVASGIAQASRFASLDPYRAVTHNKGIMNGIDAVALATGQDFRGLEAGAHAFASLSGHYRPIAVWHEEAGMLKGRIELPMAVGTVGGAISSHLGATLALRIMGEPSAERLGQIIASAGLASNLAALRALATEGIQRGHMNLHQRRAKHMQKASPALLEPAKGEKSAPPLTVVASQ